MSNTSRAFLYLLLLAMPPLLDAQSVSPAPANTLRSGDIVRLRIWREQDLSGDFLVDEQGVVVFPKIGPRDVTQETVESLRALLREDFRRYLVNPSIEVTLLRRVNVRGAVRQQGFVLLDPTQTTLGQAIALAGGVLDHGDVERTRIIRQGVVVADNLPSSTRILNLPIQSGDEIVVPQRGWIARNPGIVSTVVGGVISVVVTLIAINN